jgi:hypothetical protein
MLPAGRWVGEAGYEKFEATVRIVEAAMEALGYSFITAYGHWEMAKKRLEKLLFGQCVTALGLILIGGNVLYFGRAWPRLIKNLDWCFIKLFGLSGEFD